jgi:hypothetical protein
VPCSRRAALPLALLTAVAAGGAALAVPAGKAPVVPVDRSVAPLVLTGAQLAGWAGPAATGVAAQYPSGATADYTGQLPDGLRELADVRSAHNGVLAPVPPAPQAVPVDDIAAYSWTGEGWREVPVQVDERFPHFLANSNSDFGFYSGTDQELTYAWGPTAHSTGEEAWKKVFGDCTARYADSVDEVRAAIAAGVVKPGLGERLSTGPDGTPVYDLEAYLGPKADPAVGLDEDDEVALQARDAGPAAPRGTAPPAGATDGRTVTVADPLDPQGTRYLYLFRKPGGSSFSYRTAEVQMTRDADADEWIDRGSFAAGSPEQLGSSNTGYGANLAGTVCDPSGAVRRSTDRFPRDGMTVTTPTYSVKASGRWMVREVRVRDAAAPTSRTVEVCDGKVRGKSEGKGKGRKNGHDRECYEVVEPLSTTYGPDLVDRWKGRAFQQSPDSEISVVGFEDEQVNWEGNAALLGWRQGPVRAIREVWGADSGTNVTKTETYYRDADVYRYRVRVHPIPSDGLYTSWDYNRGTASTYYNLLKPQGVPIDGTNDDTGNVDSVPVGGLEQLLEGDLPGALADLESASPAYFDAPDPTFDVPSAVDRPEQVAGKGSAGSLVYVFEFKGATSLTNAAAVPYYRDDACLDDGTGDDPVARPWPGERSTDQRVRDGYAAGAGVPFDQVACTQKQGAHGSHGIHFFATGDSDNAFVGGATLNEVDGQQWRFSVPMTAPRNALVEYAGNVVTPLVTAVTPFA